MKIHVRAKMAVEAPNLFELPSVEIELGWPPQVGDLVAIMFPDVGLRVVEVTRRTWIPGSGKPLTLDVTVVAG